MVSNYSVGVCKFKAHFHNDRNNKVARQDGSHSGVTSNCKHVEVEIHGDICGVAAMRHYIHRKKGKEEHILDGVENGSSFWWSNHRQHGLGTCLL